MSNVWVPQAIPGLFMVGKPLLADSRGSFHKILCETPTNFTTFLFDEIYWSTSEKGVARGMHLQIPPFDGRKLVFATAGRVQDMVIDLRVGSPTFNQLWQAELTPHSAGVLIPAGCAHGFLALEGPATLVYAQEGAYNQECDTGVSLTTIGIESVSLNSNMSQRDRELPTLTEFNSPFVFDQSEYPNWEAQS
jgi:dTDP-4-dehydrorhamnose 3,5-epimerase-like enzyme